MRNNIHNTMRKRRTSHRFLLISLLLFCGGSIRSTECYVVHEPYLPKSIPTPEDEPISQRPPVSVSVESSPYLSIPMSSQLALSSSPSDVVLSPFEVWCLHRMDRWYTKSQSLKCPFLRRRSGDILDTLEAIMKHVTIRKVCWPLMGPPQAHRPAGTNKKTNTLKHKGLSVSQLYQHVLEDWKPETDGKGYYITGKLTTQVYKDSCLFLGPDPDMPIHGLRKYVGVASHLFDYDTSMATLHSLEIEELDSKSVLVAKWTLSGILRLPWKPSLPTFSGTTIYHIDGTDGLITCHEESWDCSVARAFCHTLLPELAHRIWSNDHDTKIEQS
mmetsp:Transcript_6392/g.11721  ORF Transcript_6392/g.11721 Transcript_6392/m.11721 type:complete len:329 (+) Transcript_6392:100-1086(+)